MIFKAINKDGFYVMAESKYSALDENGELSESISHYVIPESRTILKGTDGVHNWIEHNPDSGTDISRLTNAEEFRGKDWNTFVFKYPEDAAYCVKVAYDSEIAPITLKEFDESGHNRSEIISATTTSVYSV